MKVEQRPTTAPDTVADLSWDQVNTKMRELIAEVTRLGGVVEKLHSSEQVTATRTRGAQLNTPARLQAVEPDPADRSNDIRDRIRWALTKESLNIKQLAKTIREPVEALAEIIKSLREEDLVYNVGYEDSAIWTWRVGNEVDTPTLIQVVRRLLSERPMWARDVVRATGAAESRVQGAIVEVQRTDKIIDLSGGGHAKKYFLISEFVADATLPPKTVKGKPVKHGERREAREKNK